MKKLLLPFLLLLISCGSKPKPGEVWIRYYPVGKYWKLDTIIINTVERKFVTYTSYNWESEGGTQLWEILEYGNKTNLRPHIPVMPFQGWSEDTGSDATADQVNHLNEVISTQPATVIIPDDRNDTSGGAGKFHPSDKTPAVKTEIIHPSKKGDAVARAVIKHRGGYNIGDPPHNETTGLGELRLTNKGILYSVTDSDLPSYYRYNPNPVFSSLLEVFGPGGILVANVDTCRVLTVYDSAATIKTLIHCIMFRDSLDYLKYKNK